MADLKYYDGTNWVTLKGSGVALSTVGVDMTDCDLTPDGANGAFTADGSEADGTQKYKLDLNLPRGAVVTESADQPATESSCAGDLWIDPNGDAPPDEESIDPDSMARAFAAWQPSTMQFFHSYKIVGIEYKQKALYWVYLEEPVSDGRFCALATADVLGTETNCMVAITRIEPQYGNLVYVVTSTPDGSGGQRLEDPDYVKMVLFHN